MQNIATSKLSIININNKTSTNPLVRFSVFPSTKSRFLCYFGLRNPRFRAFRAQNQGFCALLGSGTTVFGHFEHKIEVFVRFLPSTPRFRAFRAQNRHFCARAEGQVASGSVIAETLSVNVEIGRASCRERV